MKEGTKVIINAGVTILAAVIGLWGGKSIVQQNIQQQIYNVLGDNSNVTVNDISSVLTDYENLKVENESIKEQNSSYYSELQVKNEELSEIKQQMKKVPDIQYKNLSLCIDSENIPINSQQSMIILDGKEYLSKDFADKLIPKDQNITVKDDTLYIGKVIANKASLFTQNVLNNSGIVTEFTKKDSYGNTRTNGLCCLNRKSSIIYSFDQKYSYLKCNISMSNEYYMDYTTTLSIKADDDIVYTVDLVKITEPFDIEIPINNCKLLTIEVSSEVFQTGCIITDAILYN